MVATCRGKGGRGEGVGRRGWGSGEDIHKLLDPLNEQPVYTCTCSYMCTCPLYVYTDLVCDGGLALEGVAHILSIGSDL